MKTTRRVMKSLGAVLLACGALLAATTPGATAAPTTAAASQATLAAPKLTSATKNGDNMIVVWWPQQTEGVKDYLLYADGKFVQRMFSDNIEPEDRSLVSVASRGLTGKETLTVAAEDSAGNLSPQSNGLVARPPVTLTPTPEMVSAVIKGDKVTLTWKPSHTDEASGSLWYGFFVNGKAYKNQVAIRDVTSVTLPVSDDDPVDPTAFGPGSKVQVVATDYTMFKHSATSAAISATTG